MRYIRRYFQFFMLFAVFSFILSGGSIAKAEEVIVDSLENKMIDQDRTQERRVVSTSDSVPAPNENLVRQELERCKNGDLPIVLEAAEASPLIGLVCPFRMAGNLLKTGRLAAENATIVKDACDDQC